MAQRMNQGFLQYVDSLSLLSFSVSRRSGGLFFGLASVVHS